MGKESSAWELEASGSQVKSQRQSFHSSFCFLSRKVRDSELSCLAQTLHFLNQRGSVVFVGRQCFEKCVVIMIKIILVKDIIIGCI